MDDPIGFLIGIAILGAIIYQALKESISSSDRSSTHRSGRPPPRSTYTRRSSPPPTVRDARTYRPKRRSSSSSHKKIRFNYYQEIDSRTADQDIKDLVDALTGAPLNPLLGLYRCRRCKVFYQTNSLEVIRVENQGRCVSCLTPAIVAVTAEQRGRNAEVDVITLQNFRQYVGRVITFEGYVHNVLVSQRGLDYAVMFEDRSWTRGFKMVVFRGDVNSVGGRRFIMGLEGHTVRVRGLLNLHETFGYEIIVSDQAMILSVR